MDRKPTSAKWLSLLINEVSLVPVSSDRDLLDYLQVLAQLTKNFGKMLKRPSHTEEDDYDSDNEENMPDASEKSEIMVCWF